MLEKYADRMINPVYDAMQKANVTTADIDTFEIVGGLTRIPYVQQLIKDRIGLEPGAHLNGDEAMAHGAAIIAANYTSDVQVKAIWLSDAIPYDILVDFYNPEDPEFKKSTVAFK